MESGWNRVLSKNTTSDSPNPPDIMHRATSRKTSTSRWVLNLSRQRQRLMKSFPLQFIRHDTLGFEYLDQSKNFAPQVWMFFFIYRYKCSLAGWKRLWTDKKRNQLLINRNEQVDVTLDLVYISISREDVLNQKKKNPDANEAFEVNIWNRFCLQSKRYIFSTMLSPSTTQRSWETFW